MGQLSFPQLILLLMTARAVWSATPPIGKQRRSVHEVRINAQMFQRLETKMIEAIDTKLDFHFKGLSQRFALFLSEVDNMNQGALLNLDAEEAKMKLSKIEKRQDRMKKMLHSSITQSEIIAANQLRITSSLEQINDDIQKNIKLNLDVANSTKNLTQTAFLLKSQSKSSRPANSAFTSAASAMENLSTDLTRKIDNLHVFMGDKFTSQAKQLASHGNHLSRQISLMGENITKQHGDSMLLSHSRLGGLKSSLFLKDTTPPDITAYKSVLEDVITDHQSTTNRYMDMSRDILLRDLKTMINPVETQNCDYSNVLQSNRQAVEGQVQQVQAELAEINNNIKTSSNSVMIRLDRFEHDIESLSDQITTSRQAQTNSSTTIYKLIDKSTGTLPETVERLFKQSSLATTQLFLTELQKVNNTGSRKRSYGYKSKGSSKFQPVGIDSGLLKSQQASLEILESKVDSTLSKLNRMDRNTEHNQGRLESRFDQLEHAQQRLYKTTTSNQNRMNDLMPEMINALANIRLTWQTNHRNISLLFNRTAEAMMSQGEDNMNVFETRVTKLMREGFNGIFTTVSKLEQLELENGAITKSVFQNVRATIANLQNSTMKRYELVRGFEDMKQIVEGNELRMTKNMAKELKSLHQIIDATKRAYSMDMSLLSSHVETVSQKQLTSTRKMIQDVIHLGITQPVNGSFQHTFQELENIQRQTIQRQLQINEILRIIEVVSREQQRYQGRIENRIQNVQNAIGMLDGPGHNITSHLLPVLKGTIKMNHDTMLNRFSESHGTLDSMQRKIARLDHLVQEKLKDIDFQLTALSNHTANSDLSVSKITRLLNDNTEQIESQFVEQRTLSENLQRTLIRSQGKLESRMEHVERTQETLEDVIIQTKDILVRVVSVINPLSPNDAVALQRSMLELQKIKEQDASNKNIQNDKHRNLVTRENKAFSEKLSHSINELTDGLKEISEIKAVCKREAMRAPPVRRGGGGSDTNTPDISHLESMIRSTAEKVDSQMYLLSKLSDRGCITEIDGSRSRMAPENRLEVPKLVLPTMPPCEQVFEYPRYGTCYEKQIAITFGGKYDEWVSGEAYQGDDRLEILVDQEINDDLSSDIYLPDPDNLHSQVGSMYSVSVFFQDTIVLCSGWRATADCYYLHKNSNRWVKGLPLPGGGRHAMAGIVYEDYFLVMGGCASSAGYPVLNSVVALGNITDSNWHHVAPMVERRSYHSCVIFPSFQYAEAIGEDGARKIRSYDKYGRNEFDWGGRGDVTDQAKNENAIKSHENSFELEATPMIYCSGGYVGTKRLRTVERLRLSEDPNIKFDQWEIHSELELAVTQHTMVSYQDKMLVIGGNGAETSIQMYQQGSGRWVVLEQKLPIELIGHSASVFQDYYIFIRGGWHTRSTALKLEPNSTSSITRPEELSFKITTSAEKDELPERMFPTVVQVPKRFFYEKDGVDSDGFSGGRGDV